MNQAIMHTPQTAPRDLNDLERLGHYTHKRLADDLSKAGVQIFREDSDKAAFLSATSKARAEMLLDGLQRFDAQHGGGQPAQTRQPATPSTVTQVPATQAATTKRAPVTQQTAAPAANGNNGQSNYGLAQHAMGANAPAQTPAAAPNASPALVELLSTVKAIAEKQAQLEASFVDLDGKLDSVLNALDIQTQITEKQSTMLHSSMQVQNLLLGVLSLFGEQVLQAPKEAFLPDAVGVAAEALALLDPGEGKEG